METERPRRRQHQPSVPPAAVAVATAVAMSTVLGDDNLLREILLRVGLPGSLVGAALVCKRWLRHAADAAFLRQFRARHSPYLIGAYLSTAGGATPPRPRFLPIQPQLPGEFAAAARRAGSFFDAALLTGFSASISIRDIRGSRLLVATLERNYGRYDSTHQVCRPLSEEEDTVVVVPPPTPPLPRMVTDDPEVEDSGVAYYCHEFLPDDDDDDDDSGDGGGRSSASYSCVLMGYSDRQTTVHLYELQDWCWVLRASAAAQQLRASPPRSKAVVLVGENRFYMLSTINKILVCDFQSSSISAMELPDGVEEGHTGRIMLSRGDGSAIYLIHVEESHLRVFRSDDNNAGSCWTLENHISLQELRATQGIVAVADRPSSVGGNDAGVKIHAVGDNARFVFLEMHGAVVFLDITSKQANKIYEMTREDKELVGVHPLTLKCPHVFLRSPDQGAT